MPVRGASPTQSTTQRQVKVLSETNPLKHDTIPDMIFSRPLNGPLFRRVCHSGILLTMLCLLSLQSFGQRATPAASPAQNTSTSSRPDAFWRGELPGGVYLVALRSVVSISSHEYVVDGLARVTEVNIATASTVEARFYFLEPMAANSSSTTAATLEVLQQRVQELSASHPEVDAVWQKVVKNYPTTTHAHTVEYRLSSKANLQSLYDSLEQAWTTGKGVNFKTE